MNLDILKNYFFLSIIILSLSIINISAGQSTNNIDCKQQLLSIEHIGHKNTSESVSELVCPLPSYTQAQQLISNGNPEKAIRLLEKEMTGLFPFRFPATNGYEIYFYYYKLLGDAYSAADNPVEAIDAYRSALSPVPYAAITNSPIPYAKGLYGFGKQLMKIYRWADAEEILRSALQLAQNDRLNADYFWVKTVRFSSLGNNKFASKFAEKCVEFAPDYNWAAWHKLTHSKYASGKRVEAVDDWLDGLSAFKYALPITDVPKYLNRALPYWKSATDEQIIRYYEILKELVICNTPNSKNEMIESIKKDIDYNKDIWCARITVPSYIYSINYYFSKKKTDDKLSNNMWHIFLPGSSNTFGVEVRLVRDYPITVTFTCNASDIIVSNAIYIAGNNEQLGNWTPNKTKMYDDGTHGDKTPGDKVWSLKIKLPAGLNNVEYKYLNSGIENVWENQEEISQNRKIELNNFDIEFETNDKFGAL